MKGFFRRAAAAFDPNPDRDVAIALAIIGVGIGVLRKAVDEWLDERRMIDQHHNALHGLVDELWEAHCQAHPEARPDVDVPERDDEVMTDG